MQCILGDGILQGCELSTAGFTLNMSAGSLILCGRNIRHTTSEGWAVNGESAGFARLVVTIDLSKTSTIEAFEQIETAVEYSTTADGFPALEQSDINDAGVRYQAEVCVVSLSTGGITGIVRQIAKVSSRINRDICVDGVNMNTVKAAGRYYGSTMTNAGESGRSVFDVEVYDESCLTQTQKRIADDGTVRLYVRSFYNGTTWSPWRPILTNILPDSMLGTVEPETGVRNQLYFVEVG